MSEQAQIPDPVQAQILARACGSTGAVLAALERSDLGRPTPCALWSVREVVNHILGGAAYFTELAEAGAVPEREEDEPDFAAGDFSAAFRGAASRLTAAYDAPGVMDQPLQMPMGPMPGSACAWIAAGDIFTHGWDLARATGQPTDLEPELAGMLLAQVSVMLPDSMRGPEGQAPFGPEVKVAAAVPPADRPGRLPRPPAVGDSPRRPARRRRPAPRRA